MVGFFLKEQWRCCTVTVVNFFFGVFLGFLVDHACDHSLRSLFKLEVLCLAFVLSPYIIIVFISSQWCCFTITAVDCYILKLFYDSSSSVTATDCWFWWLQRKLLFWAIKLLLYIMIVYLQAQWRYFTITVVVYCILMFSFQFYSWMSATTCLDRWLCWKYFDGRSYYHHISSLFFSQHNGVFSPSALSIVIFWSFIWFLLMDDCNHSLVSLISLEVLF